MKKDLRWLCLFVLIVVSTISVPAQEMIVANDAQIIPPAPSTAVFKRYMGE